MAHFLLVSVQRRPVTPSLSVATEVPIPDPLIGASRPSPGGASLFSVHCAIESIGGDECAMRPLGDVPDISVRDVHSLTRRPLRRHDRQESRARGAPDQGVQGDACAPEPEVEPYTIFSANA